MYDRDHSFFTFDHTHSYCTPVNFCLMQFLSFHRSSGPHGAIHLSNSKKLSLKTASRNRLSRNSFIVLDICQSCAPNDPL